MRTTITIPEVLLQEVREVSGKDKYSEAIVTTLREHLALLHRLSFLDRLFKNKLPHAWKQIKKSRKRGQWSS